MNNNLKSFHSKGGTIKLSYKSLIELKHIERALEEISQLVKLLEITEAGW